MGAKLGPFAVDGREPLRTLMDAEPFRYGAYGRP
jgi:hypothetical protein